MHPMATSAMSIHTPSGNRSAELVITLHQKWSFPLRISSVNVTNSLVSCVFGHIYWRNPSRKTSFFVQCLFLFYFTFLLRECQFMFNNILYFFLIFTICLRRFEVIVTFRGSRWRCSIKKVFLKVSHNP